MSSIVRMLQNTIHNLTGPLRRGDVVEVPEDLATHWTDQKLAEDAAGAELTEGVPQVEDSEGHWAPDQAEIDRRAQNRPPDTTIGAITRADVGGGPSTQPTVAEPTSGPMTGENGAVAPPAPTVAPPAPTVAEVEPAPAETPGP